MTRGRIELGDVTPHNIKQLKRLNQRVFPVSYNEKFYKDVLEVGELAKLAYFNDVVVGAVCCRIDNADGIRRMYIMTLGCLAPYRRLGIGTEMVKHVVKLCERDGNIDNIYLHVQINNDSAVKFYEQFDFRIRETKENYYKKIEPADAFVLQKTLRERPELETTATTTSAKTMPSAQTDLRHPAEPSPPPDDNGNKSKGGDVTEKPVGKGEISRTNKHTSDKGNIPNDIGPS